MDLAILMVEQEDINDEIKEEKYTGEVSSISANESQERNYCPPVARKMSEMTKGPEVSGEEVTVVMCV